METTTAYIIKSGRKKFTIEPGDYIMSDWRGYKLYNKDVVYRDPFKITAEAAEAFKALPGVIRTVQQTITCNSVVKYTFQGKLTPALRGF